MKIHKIDGELYVEWTSPTAVAKEVLKMAGLTVFGIVSFYALWVLLDLIA
jgi:hypothetical protein